MTFGIVDAIEEGREDANDAKRDDLTKRVDIGGVWGGGFGRHRGQCREIRVEMLLEQGKKVGYDRGGVCCAWA